MILKLLKKKEVLLNGKTHVNGADGVGVLNGKNGYAGDDRTENPVMDYRPGANGKSSRNGQDFLIELHGIEKIYETEAGPFLALKAIDLNINEGEFVAIIGKSGSGKSTLINMLTGIDHPTAGDVRIGDARLGDLNEGQMATWRGSNMGIVFQFFQLLPTLTIVENVMIPMDLAQKYDPAERYERAMNLLQLVDMAEEAHKFPSVGVWWATTAGGYRQGIGE